MNQAQAARQTPEEEPAANVKPDEPNYSQGEDAEESESDESESEESELDEYDLDDEDDIGRRTVELLSRVRQQIRKQPLTAASGAFILGFAIGNGVPKFLARAGIAVGLRLVMQRMFDRAELYEEA
jgi:hypothetical protein